MSDNFRLSDFLLQHPRAFEALRSIPYTAHVHPELYYSTILRLAHESSGEGANPIALQLHVWRALAEVWAEKKQYHYANGILNLIIHLCRRASQRADPEVSGAKEAYARAVAVCEQRICELEERLIVQLGLAPTAAIDRQQRSQRLCQLNRTTSARVEECTRFLEQRSPLQTAIRELFRLIQQDNLSIMRLILEDSLELLPDLKGELSNVAFVCVGSQARQAATPFSDMEWVILLQSSEESDEHTTDRVKSRLRLLSALVQFRLISLGHTILPSLSIPGLNDDSRDADQLTSNWFYDDVTPRGFSSDGLMPGACKSPLGNAHIRSVPASDRFELIGTADEMLRYHSDRYFALDPHLSTVLTTVQLISGNAVIVADYMARLRAFYRQPASEEQLQQLRAGQHAGLSELPTAELRGQARALQLMEESLSVYSDRSGRVQSVGQIDLDVKKDLHRLTDMALDHLALFFDAFLSPIWWARLTSLAAVQNPLRHERAFQHPESCNNLEAALGKVLMARLKSHVRSQRAADATTLTIPERGAAISNSTISAPGGITDEPIESLNYSDYFDIYTVLVPFQQEVVEFFEWRGYCQFERKYDSPAAHHVKAEIFARIHEYGSAKQELRLAVADDSAHLYMLATLLLTIGEYKEGIELLEQLHHSIEGRHLFNGPRIVDSLIQACLAIGHIRAAERWLHVLISRNSQPQPGRPHLPQARKLQPGSREHNLWLSVQTAKGHFQPEVRFLESRLALGGTGTPARPLALARAQLRLSTLKMLEDDVITALRLQQESINAHIRTLGPRHPTVASLLRRLASLYMRQGKLYEAVQTMRRAAEIQAQSDYSALSFSVVETHIRSAALLWNIAKATDDQRCLQQAAHLLATLQQRTTARVMAGDLAIRTLQTDVDATLAEVHQHRRQWRAAIVLYEAALLRTREQGGESGFSAAFFLLRLSFLHLQEGAPTLATLLLSESAAVYAAELEELGQQPTDKSRRHVKFMHSLCDTALELSKALTSIDEDSASALLFTLSNRFPEQARITCALASTYYTQADPSHSAEQKRQHILDVYNNGLKAHRAGITLVKFACFLLSCSSQPPQQHTQALQYLMEAVSRFDVADLPITDLEIRSTAVLDAELQRLLIQHLSAGESVQALPIAAIVCVCYYLDVRPQRRLAAEWLQRLERYIRGVARTSDGLAPANVQLYSAAHRHLLARVTAGNRRSFEVRSTADSESAAAAEESVTVVSSLPFQMCSLNSAVSSLVNLEWRRSGATEGDPFFVRSREASGLFAAGIIYRTAGHPGFARFFLSRCAGVYEELRQIFLRHPDPTSVQVIPSEFVIFYALYLRHGEEPKRAASMAVPLLKTLLTVVQQQAPEKMVYLQADNLVILRNDPLLRRAIPDSIHLHDSRYDIRLQILTLCLLHALSNSAAQRRRWSEQLRAIFAASTAVRARVIEWRLWEIVQDRTSSGRDQTSNERAPAGNGEQKSVESAPAEITAAGAVHSSASLAVELQWSAELLELAQQVSLQTALGLRRPPSTKEAEAGITAKHLATSAAVLLTNATKGAAAAATEQLLRAEATLDYDPGLEAALAQASWAFAQELLADHQWTQAVSQARRVWLLEPLRLEVKLWIVRVQYLAIAGQQISLHHSAATIIEELRSDIEALLALSELILDRSSALYGSVAFWCATFHFEYSVDQRPPEPVIAVMEKALAVAPDWLTIPLQPDYPQLESVVKAAFITAASESAVPVRLKRLRVRSWLHFLLAVVHSQTPGFEEKALLHAEALQAVVGLSGYPQLKSADQVLLLELRARLPLVLLASRQHGVTPDEKMAESGNPSSADGATSQRTVDGLFMDPAPVWLEYWRQACTDKRNMLTGAMRASLEEAISEALAAEPTLLEVLRHHHMAAVMRGADAERLREHVVAFHQAVEKHWPQLVDESERFELLSAVANFYADFPLVEGVHARALPLLYAAAEQAEASTTIAVPAIPHLLLITFPPCFLRALSLQSQLDGDATYQLNATNFTYYVLALIALHNADTGTAGEYSEKLSAAIRALPPSLRTSSDVVMSGDLVHELELRGDGARAEENRSAGDGENGLPFPPPSLHGPLSDFLHASGSAMIEARTILTLPPNSPSSVHEKSDTIRLMERISAPSVPKSSDTISYTEIDTTLPLFEHSDSLRLEDLLECDPRVAGYCIRASDSGDRLCIVIALQHDDEFDEAAVCQSFVDGLGRGRVATDFVFEFTSADSQLVLEMMCSSSAIPALLSPSALSSVDPISSSLIATDNSDGKVDAEGSLFSVPTDSSCSGANGHISFFFDCHSATSTVVQGELRMLSNFHVLVRDRQLATETDENQQRMAVQRALLLARRTSEWTTQGRCPVTVSLPCAVSAHHCHPAGRVESGCFDNNDGRFLDCAFSVPLQMSAVSPAGSRSKPLWLDKPLWKGSVQKLRDQVQGCVRNGKTTAWYLCANHRGRLAQVVMDAKYNLGTKQIPANLGFTEYRSVIRLRPLDVQSISAPGICGALLVTVNTEETDERGEHPWLPLGFHFLHKKEPRCVADGPLATSSASTPKLVVYHQHFAVSLVAVLDFLSRTAYSDMHNPVFCLYHPNTTELSPSTLPVALSPVQAIVTPIIGSALVEGEPTEVDSTRFVRLINKAWRTDSAL